MIAQDSSPLLPHGEFRIRVLLAMVRYHWFIRLRWLMILGALALLVAERLYEPDFKRPVAVVLCVAVVALVNVLWTVLASWILREIHEANGISMVNVRRVVIFANAQMTVDLLMLTAILRFTGGIENPMAIFYLFHMLIAALLLRPLNALWQGAWAVFLYAALGFGECLGWIVPHYPFMASAAEVTLHQDWVFVLAGVGVLAAGVWGTLFFTLQISLRLDDQERELFEAKRSCEVSRDAIQHLQDRRARFMRTAAHQLKSPLTGIEMLAGLIRDKVVGADKLDDTAARIIKRCQEGIGQVTELLTLERIEQAAPARHVSSTTDVVEIIYRVVKRVADQARSKDLQMRLDLPRSAGFVAVDASDLEDCIVNLLDNAVKYTPAQGTVRVVAECQEQHIIITVQDSGMGITEDALETIFEPFRRGNSALAANIPGSGLGLAIVREVVTQAGGRVDVQSTVDSGSTFVLTLPRPEGGATKPEAMPDSMANARAALNCL